MPPLVNPADPLSVAALGAYVAQTTPGQDGFYVESGYKFFNGMFKNHERFDEGAYVMPVVRIESVRRDRTLSDFYLNQFRTTFGVTLRGDSLSDSTTTRFFHPGITTRFPAFMPS